MQLVGGWLQVDECNVLMTVEDHDGDMVQQVQSSGETSYFHAAITYQLLTTVSVAQLISQSGDAVVTMWQYLRHVCSMSVLWQPLWLFFM